jgi:hypothetical protein
MRDLVVNRLGGGVDTLTIAAASRWPVVGRVAGDG